MQGVPETAGMLAAVRIRLETVARPSPVQASALHGVAPEPQSVLAVRFGPTALLYSRPVQESSSGS